MSHYLPGKFRCRFSRCRPPCPERQFGKAFHPERVAIVLAHKKSGAQPANSGRAAPGSRPSLGRPILMMSQNSFALASARAISPGPGQRQSICSAADVDRRWDRVVARLAHVDVIVRMDPSRRSICRRAGGPVAITSFAFVLSRPGTGLENVEREMLVEFSFHYFSAAGR